MLIVPAIDIINGECVRLIQGDFESKTTYSLNPLLVLQKFIKAGANLVHVVDLDAAKSGELVNRDLILRMVAVPGANLQVGGGIRNLESAQYYLNNGVRRIVLGTAALQNPELLSELLLRYGADRIIVGLDFKDGKPAVNGWQNVIDVDEQSFYQGLLRMGVKRVVVTDISRDGTFNGPNIPLLKKIMALGFIVSASGGVGNYRDLKDLRENQLCEAIVGKALYEGKIDLSQVCTPLTKRIIPCLDIKNGRVVKGRNFIELQDMGDALQLAKKYENDGADELVFLDIAASVEGRNTLLDLVRRLARNIFVPFTVGGGIGSLRQAREVLLAGADKVCINTAAVLNPNLISQLAEKFGSQCVVVAMDVKKIDFRGKPTYKVFIRGGIEDTQWEMSDWAKKAAALGAGEILLTSIDRDGTGKGFDTQALALLSRQLSIPVIASGGAGDARHFVDALQVADAALVAGVLHRNELKLVDIKEILKNNFLSVRL